MPWGEKSAMSQREEFVKLAQEENSNISSLCQEYGISRKTGHKWLNRAKQGLGMGDLPRRPHHSSNQISIEMEGLLLKERIAHPEWGAKKIQRVLRNEGNTRLPAPSTITTILKRNGFIDEQKSLKHKAFIRFEYKTPNDLWQADFKGNRGRAHEVGCHPLTVLDDHSRFCIGLRACPDERKETVQSEFTKLFRQYGMPLRMLMDNGPPWGNPTALERFTSLTVWLMVLGIGVSHGRPCHPQTQGKDERFNGTLEAEVMRHYGADDWEGYQPIFDKWRDVYNLIRPHEALNMLVPADCYQPSQRPFPEKLPPVIYDEGMELRKADSSGWIWFRGKKWYTGIAFRGYYVALVSTEIDGVFNVMFMSFCVSTFDLRTV
jgi:transposase InsO family protein